MPVAVIYTHGESLADCDNNDAHHAKLSADLVAEVTKAEHTDDGARECEGGQNRAATFCDHVFAVELG